MDLITRERALRNLTGLSSPTAAEYLAIDSMIRAASDAIEKFCRRSFAAQHRDELYNGTGKSSLLLNEFPILNVERVAYGPTAVLRVTNTSASNQRATVKVTATGLTLTHVASGTTTANSPTFAANATITALNTAINAIGSGWSAAVVDSTYSNWPSADLRALQGALACKNVDAELRIHVSELSDYEIDERRGILTMGHARSAEEQSTWFGGVNYWRIVYTAGYETVPEDVQEACAQWTAALFWQTKRDPGLAQETLIGAVTRAPFTSVSAAVLELLRPYRKHSLASL